MTVAKVLSIDFCITNANIIYSQKKINTLLKKGRNMLGIEWKKIWKNKFMVIVLIAIVSIPSIYAVGFLKSMWDPYGKIKDLPVAVINEDKSVQYNGKTLAVGNKLQKSLKKSDAMDFSFPSQETAKKGLSQGKYYMVMTIPDDFSKNATTLLDDHPKKMLIHYTTSSGHSFIAGKFSKSAAESIGNSISSQVTKTYAETLFKQIQTLGNGMGTAGDANKKLGNGTQQLQSGNQTITTNLQTLASSSLTFSSGTHTLTDGLSQYFSGINQLDTGSLKLTSGLNQLDNQIPILGAGVSQLANGSSSMNVGLQQYTTGVNQLNTGVSALHTGAQKLADGGGSLTAGVDKLTTGADNLSQGVSAYTQGTDESYKGSQKISDGLAQMNQALNSDESKNQVTQLQTGLQNFQLGLNQLKSSLDNNNQNSEQITSLTTSMNSLASNVVTLGNYINGTQGKIQDVAKSQKLTDAQVNALQTALLPTDDINNSLKSTTSNLNDLQKNLTVLMNSSDKSRSPLKTIVDTLNSNYGTSDDTKTVYGGVNRLISSLTQVSRSTEQLNTGAAQLTGGLSQLSGQSQQLVNGSAQLQAGLARLNTNVPSLTNGLEKLANGSTKLSEGTQKLSQNGDKLNVGSQKITSGLSALTEKVPALGSGVSQLSAGSGQLTNGLDKLAGNSDKLLTGSNQLANGAIKIADGSRKLADGSAKLGDGLIKVKAGNNTLSDKLSQTHDKVNKLNPNKLTYSQLAKPASTKHFEKDKVPNNGTSMAPYMLSVALFVGAVAFNLMFDLVTPLKYPKKAISWWASKMSVLYPFAFVQAAMMYLISMSVIGIKPVHAAATFGVLILISFTFISVVTALNLWFGKVGSFLSMILMVIQLGGSAGTYPIQLSNGFFEAINPYLPMTYSVSALRETLMIGGSSKPDVIVMLLIFIVFTGIMIGFYMFKQLKIKKINYEHS